MNNFQYINPTRIVFGEGEISKLETLIPKKSKILILYGGGSIKKNGVHEQVLKSLKDFEVLEFGGIPPNPEYSVLMKALEIIKKENITFLLAVGGGSIIDGTKFLSASTLYEGDDPWGMMTNRDIKKGLPFGTVLTLPATSSEMNSGAVINREEKKEKLSFGGEGLFPKFSILDPSVIKSIPKNQLVNGLVDSFVHVLEQYMTYPIGAILQDKFSESIFSSIIETAPHILEEEFNYKYASNFMWTCTMALNGLIRSGVPEDWTAHLIGHELTALFGIDHAKTLAIVLESIYNNRFENKKEKLAQYAEKVWGVTNGDIDEKAKKGISKTIEFFHSLGIKTKLSNYTDNYEGTAELIAKRFEDRKWLDLGEKRDITPNDVEKIVKNSY